MKLTKADGSFLEVKVIDASRKILINYTLVETTSSVVRSIDRGQSTDRYEATFTIRGEREYVNSVLIALTELRIAQKKVVLTECQERYFADNIDHDVALNCVVTDMGKLHSPKLNVLEFTISLLLDKPIFIQTDPLIEFPSLKCLQSEYETYGKWNTQVNEIYYRDSYFVDSGDDTYVFKGDYILSIYDSAILLNHWKAVRGSEIVIDESDFGVVNMFGPIITGSTHKVIITNIEYDYISTELRRYTIELLRVKDNT